MSEQVTETGFEGIRTWPNVIMFDFVGLATTVDSIHKIVGERMKYTNLNTGTLSMTFFL
jgi:hypothetical protein